MSDSNPGYHIRQISKGKLGEISKVREELEELEDSLEQGVKVMALVELSDLIGAVKALLSKKFPGFTLRDLEAMADVTARAFTSGARIR